MAGAASTARAQGRLPNLDAYLTIANDYRARGLSQVASGASWQLGADYEHASGFFVGGLLANVDYAIEARREQPREHVVDVYAGYAWGRSSWRFNVALGRYVYPDIDVDYDYTEASFGASYMNRFFYSASYADTLFSLPFSAWHQELGVAQPLRWNFEISAAVGRFASDAVAEGGYTHWNVGVSKVLRRVGLDLRFHESSLAGYSHVGNPGAERWVLSVSYGFPRR